MCGLRMKARGAGSQPMLSLELMVPSKFSEGTRMNISEEHGAAIANATETRTCN
jgi:hypothetical protein